MEYIVNYKQNDRLVILDFDKTYENSL